MPRGPGAKGRAPSGRVTRLPFRRQPEEVAVQHGRLVAAPDDRLLHLLPGDLQEVAPQEGVVAEAAVVHVASQRQEAVDAAEERAAGVVLLDAEGFAATQNVAL